MITLILGESGSGKTRSIKSLDPEKTAVLNPVNKPFPFKTKLKQSLAEDFETLNYKLGEIIKHEGGREIYIIDDFQFYILDMIIKYEKQQDALPPSVKKDKYKINNDIAASVVDILKKCSKSKKRFYFLSHIDKDDNGFVCMKSGGKFVKEKLQIEGWFTTVLRCNKDVLGHFFETISNGLSTVKSPEDMFKSDRIDNDLALVDKAICDYYGINEVKNERPNHLALV